MKISYNWLKSYVPDLPEPEKVAEIFTFHICELEEMEKSENGDAVFDIKVLPDRAHDLLSHRGIARDLAGILGLEYKENKSKEITGVPTNLKIKVEDSLCRRYSGRIIRNVKNKPSPSWVREYLEAIGQRSISNLVDATNLVMFDCGNPVHIFDLAKVDGYIVVRKAKTGEKMITLDEKEIILKDSDLVIADEKGILALAGIKGGKKAEVDEHTKDIIIEVANFDPTSVRRTAKSANIYTDAVKRFENDLSPEVASEAMQNITALVLEVSRGAEAEEVVDIYPEKQNKRTLKFNLLKISKILGMPVDEEDIEKYFKNYNIVYKKTGDEYEFGVPYNRPDLATSEDMAEEIGRMIGYDKIKAQLPELGLTPSADKKYENIYLAREKMLADGYSEVMNYVFCDKGEVEVLASASDKKFLRTNLSDQMKESLKRNKLNAPLLGTKEIKIFEIGTVFLENGEEMHIAWNEKNEVKEMELNEFVSKKVSSEEHENFLLKIFSVRPRQGSQGSSEETFSAQSTFPKQDMNTKLIFKMWSLYPFISRDIALWVPRGVASEQVFKVIKENAGDLLVKDPYLFDEFEKDGKVSFAFRLVFQAENRTLTDEEVNKVMEQIASKITENKDWQIR